MEEMTSMLIIWHAQQLKLPKRMILLGILKDSITSKYIRLRLDLRLALYAVKEKSIYYQIDINILKHFVVCARVKTLLKDQYISLFKMMVHSLTTVFVACNQRLTSKSFPKFVLHTNHKLPI